MADDSIWKKEISFKRKPKEQADDATPAPDAEESTSLWNRELLPEVGNAAEAEAVVEETPVVEPVTDEPVAAEHVPGTVPGASPDEPVWKKEVSFSRKASQDEPVAEAYVPAEDVPGTVPEPGPDETVWKTEVSFSRKDADEDVIAEQPVPTEDVPGTVPGSGPDETVWKKEVSFEERVSDLRTRQRTLTGALVAVRKPTVAALPGPAAGAGMALALACDIRIASESAIMSTGYARIGLTGDYGIAWLLTRLVGTSRARELMFLSERIDARRCEALGLVNRVVPDAELREAAFALAKSLAEGPSIAFARIKDNLDHAVSSDFLDSMDQEAENMVRSARTTDHKEAVRAFIDKRKPTFVGH